jgi:hypothetical protein
MTPVGDGSDSNPQPLFDYIVDRLGLDPVAGIELRGTPGRR